MPGAPQQSGQSDNSSALLWVVAASFATAGFLWFAFKKQIISFYFSIKLVEIKFISIFTSGLQDVQTAIVNQDPNTFTFTDVVKVGEAVGNYLRIPFVLILFALAFVVYFGNTARVFKRTYTMKDLVELEKNNWPQITPVVGLDLIKADLDKGPWAMAMTPMQFCKRLKLLEERRSGPQEGLSRKEWNRVEVTLKRGEANKIFALQLGPAWRGVSKLPPHIKALFAIFAARYNGDTKPAQELIKKISASSREKLDFTGVDELLSKHEKSKGVQKIIQSHAYVLTVMASMLEAAREDGVQASADFLWLKPLDRRFWYMMNSIGRQTPFVEVAGPFAHWKAEKEIGRKLLVPMVEEATNALELALKEIIYKPDEEEEK